jgi:hypothetical protein
MPLADVDEIEDDASDFNTNTSAILQGITMTSLPDIGNILIAIFYRFHSFILNGKLSVEQI